MNGKLAFNFVLSLFICLFSLNAFAEAKIIGLNPTSPMINVDENDGEKDKEIESRKCDKVVLHFETLWKSKYASEGRDVMNMRKGKGGIYTFEGGVDFSNFSVGFLYAGNTKNEAVQNSSGEYLDYRESNTNIRYNLELEDFGAYLGYNRKEFIEHKEQDDEVIAGFSYSGIPYITPGFDYIHSRNEEGSYVEVYIEGEISFMEEFITLEPYVMEAFDFGYNTKNHNGANHLQVGLGASLAMCKSLKLVASINQIWAHADIKKQLDADDSDYTGNFTWGSAGVAGKF